MNSPRMTASAVSFDRRAWRAQRTRSVPMHCAVAPCLTSPLVPRPGVAVGFSLIEILVVVAILAITASVVTLSIAGAGGERQLERDAERLRALVAHACEQAELGGREIGLSFNDDGYRFSRSDHDHWLPLADGELRPRKWSVAADARLSRDGQRVEIAADWPDKPQLVCFSSGELTAFRLELGLPDSTTRYRIDGEPDGSVDEHVLDTRAR